MEKKEEGKTEGVEGGEAREKLARKKAKKECEEI